MCASPFLHCHAAAVVGVHSERGAGHAFTEDDWDLSASETFLPYHYSKVRCGSRKIAAVSKWRVDVDR